VSPVAAPAWQPEALFEAARENAVRCPPLAAPFDGYLVSGGIPLGIAEVRESGRLGPASAAVHVNAVIGDVLRAGKSEAMTRDVLRAVADLGGEAVDWQGLAERVSLGSRHTVVDYLDVLARCYVLAILPQPSTLGSAAPSPRRPRKVHFRDPFLAHVMTAWARGLQDPQPVAGVRMSDPALKGRLVEATVAGHLVSRFAQLLHWRGSFELDVIGVRADGIQVRIEVKHQGTLTSRDRRPLSRTGGGVMVSLATLAWDAAANIATIPAPLFLMSLP
jgi:predicted AAA+ superfamily ATPase